MYKIEEIINTILKGNALSVLKNIPDNSIDTCMTSPPYMGLRNYETMNEIWDGVADCNHQWRYYKTKGISGGTNTEKLKIKGQENYQIVQPTQNAFCSHCNAWWGELGQEPTVELFIKHLADIFDEVKRVLKSTGSFYLNISDSFMGSGKLSQNNIRNKSLMGVPERIMLELTNRGWILRNKIIWEKNAVPESMNDRYTRTWEYIYFFTKEENYYFEQQLEETSYKDNRPSGMHRHGQDYRDKLKTNSSKEPTGEKQVYDKVAISGIRNARDIWKISTQPFIASKYGDFDKDHYACVSEDTEILTINGWKKYTELEYCDLQNKRPKYILVATYNLNKKIIEYQRLEYINKYDFKGQLYEIKNSYLDILITENHKNIIINRKNIEVIKTINELELKDSIKLLAPVNYKENNGIGIYLAELIGWIIAEGHYIKWIKNKIKQIGAIEIYQNAGKNEKRIDFLLKKLQIPHIKKERKRKYKNKIKNQIVWYLKKSPLIDWILENIPYKNLNNFLISLPQNEIQALFNGLVAGDGHIRKDDKRISITQYNKKFHDWFQILSMRLGYHPLTNNIHTFLTKKTKINIRNTNGKSKNIKLKKYNGKVWCPTTNNGTWIARRNGKIFITGNSFPEELVRRPILASVPKHICSNCGNYRLKVYDKLGESSYENMKGKDTSHFRSEQGIKQNMRADRECYDRPAVEKWIECGCDNPSYTKTGIILDPFMGTGTTAIEAIRQDVNYIGIELNDNFIKMSEARIKTFDKSEEIIKKRMQNNMERFI